MTPEQREIARNTLGLSFGTSRISHRNYFYTGEQSDVYPIIMQMVSAGYMVDCNVPFQLKAGSEPGYHTFRMTVAGALLALDEGEVLAEEDFPKAKQTQSCIEEALQPFVGEPNNAETHKQILSLLERIVAAEAAGERMKELEAALAYYAEGCCDTGVRARSALSCQRE